jgi:hypothetical protein
MIGIEQAKTIAQRHLSANPVNHPHYRWKLVDPVEREDDWLFEYEYECTIDTPPESWESLGGSPAFVVRKADGQVVELDWSDM